VGSKQAHAIKHARRHDPRRRNHILCTYARCGSVDERFVEDSLQLGRENMHEAHQDVNACIFTLHQCMIRLHQASMHEARGSMPMHEVHGIKTNTQCRKSTGIAKSEASARYPWPVSLCQQHRRFSQASRESSYDHLKWSLDSWISLSEKEKILSQDNHQ